METLTKDPPINKKIKDETISSVINYTAIFLEKPCPNCSVKLIDPFGIKVNNNERHGRCGNCGFETFLPY